MSTATTAAGKVIQVAGPAIDIQFPEGNIPPIRTAIRITSEGFNVPGPIDIICEVAQHIGEGRVRTIALQPTDGLVRGMQAIDTGEPVSVPVGKETLGRVLNVIGEFAYPSLALLGLLIFAASGSAQNGWGWAKTGGRLSFSLYRDDLR